MVSVSPVSFQMQPGSDQTITVNVTVPQGAGEGTRYAMLRVAETQGSSGQNVGIGVELLAMPVLITLDKTTQTRTGVIQALSADATPGQPLVVKGQIKNTGNTHFGAAPDQISASAALYDATGKAVASGKTTITGDSIVPSFSRDFTITMAAAQDLAAGHYRVEVTAALGGDTLNTAALSFDVSDGQVEGATSGPLESASTASSSGDDTGVVLFALLGGLLLGGLFATVVVLTTRRRMRMGSLASLATRGHERAWRSGSPVLSAPSTVVKRESIPRSADPAAPSLGFDEPAWLGLWSRWRRRSGRWPLRPLCQRWRSGR